MAPFDFCTPMWRYFRRSSAPYCKVVESGLRCYPTTLLSFVIIFRWYLTTVLRFLHWASHGGCQQRSARRPFADRMKKEKKKAKARENDCLSTAASRDPSARAQHAAPTGTHTPRRDFCATGKKSTCITMTYDCPWRRKLHYHLDDTAKRKAVPFMFRKAVELGKYSVAANGEECSQNLTAVRKKPIGHRNTDPTSYLHKR